MTIALPARSTADATARRASQDVGSWFGARLFIVLLIAATATAGFMAVGTETASLAASRAGADLTRLLRGMALLKSLMAAGATAVVLWRLDAPVRPSWLTAYAIACGTMWAGPGLIWSMAYIGTGALLLHGGLLTSVVLIWRDPAVAARLGAMISARRAAVSSRG